MGAKGSRIRLLTASFGILLVVTAGRTQVRQSREDSRAATEAAVSQYCIGCHSAALKTGGVFLDPATLSQPASNAETWEKAIR
jgi:mono/diheme cytochrome c family protein